MIELGLSIYDVKGEVYLRPMFVRTLAVGLRDIVTELSRAESTLSLYPADYEVWQVCEFDTETATVLTEGCPRKIVDVVKLKEDFSK